MGIRSNSRSSSNMVDQKPASSANRQTNAACHNPPKGTEKMEHDYPRLSTELNPIRIRVLSGRTMKNTEKGVQMTDLWSVIELPPGAKVLEANYQVDGGEVIRESRQPH